MKIFAFLLTLALALVVPVSSSAQAPDLTGNWNANLTRTAPDGRTQTITFTFHFAQKAKALTGTVGPSPDRQWKVEKGVVDGNKVTFQVQQIDNGTKGPLRTFNLTLEKGILKGMMKAELDGQSFEVVVDAQKVK